MKLGYSDIVYILFAVDRRRIPDSSRYCGAWTVPGNGWTVPLLATLPLDPIQKSSYSDIVYCILYTVGTHRAWTVLGIAPTVRGEAAVQKSRYPDTE